LDHPEQYPLCDQEEETINHPMISCVYARQFWFNLLQGVHLQELTPQPGDTSFLEWWRKANERLPGPIKNGFNSLVILGGHFGSLYFMETLKSVFFFC
jgi:hypothetical protein